MPSPASTSGTSAGSDPKATRVSWRGKCKSSRNCRSSALPPPRRASRDMVGIFRQPITAADVKAKARELGADLVGIADGEVMNQNPPDPANPRRPLDVTELDYKRVIVLAKHLSN